MKSLTEDKRAGIYLRQSTYTSGSISADLQLENCRRLAEQYGLEVVMIDKDIDISGTHMRRPGLERLREAKKQGKFHYLLLDDLARLARNEQESLVLEAEFAPIITSKEGPQENKLVTSIHRAMAEDFIDKIKIRWNDALSHRFERGLLPSGNAQWGYTKDEAGLHQPDGNAVHVKEMYRQYVAGVGARTIAVGLNEKGVPSPTGRQWTPTTVLDLLDKSFYAGIITFKGQERDGAHEPLITLATWKAYLKTRGEKRMKKQRKEDVGQFDGLIFCGRCDSPMTTNSKGMLCTRYMNLGAGPDGCAGVFLNAEVVYSAFNIFFDELEGHRKYTEALPTINETRVELEEELAEAEALVEKAQEDYQAYQLFAFQNKISGDALSATLRDMEQTTADAQAKVDEIQAALGNMEVTGDDPLEKWTQNRLGTGELTEVEEAVVYNQAMRRLLKRIVIHPRAYEVPRDPRRFPETEVEFVFQCGDTFRLTEDYMKERKASDDVSMLYRIIGAGEVSKNQLAQALGVHHSGPFTKRVNRWVEAGVLELRVEGPRRHYLRIKPERIDFVPRIE